jgi:hypothetical protein
MMNKLKRSCVLMAFVLCNACAPDLSITDINNKRNYGPKITSPGKKINTKFSKRDLVGCLGAAILSIPFGLFVDMLSTLVSGNKVDINLSEHVIDIVKIDVEAYIEKYGNIEPKEFYSALSDSSLERLEIEMIKKFSGLSSDRYDVKKQEVAYAFLYFLETGDKTGAYKFSFDGRGENSNERGVISFNSSNKRTDAKEVGICGYVRFTDIEVRTAFSKEVVCVGKKLSEQVRFHKDNNYYMLNLLGSQQTSEYELDLNETDVENFDEKTELTLDELGSYPKINLEMVKHSETENKVTSYLEDTVRALNITTQENISDDEVESYYGSCREFLDFEF